MQVIQLEQRPVQLRGSRVARALLERLGWRIEFEGLPSLQGVIVAYPHTSNMDFPLAIMTKWAIGIPVHFWGKDSLFRIPLFGAWLRWVGGIPVNRNAPGDLVDQAAAHLSKCRENGTFAWLALAPEGTRSLAPGWRSGFYRLASQAGVPLGIAAMDYGRKQIRFSSFIRLSGDVQADMAAIASLLGDPQGYNPDQASPIRMA